MNRAATLLAPLAIAVVGGFFATPSRACDDVGYTSYGYDDGYTPYTTVVVEAPAWFWVPGVGYRYWDGEERLRYEREHRFVHVVRYEQERDWRDHRVQRERFERERPTRERFEHERWERARTERDHDQRFDRDGRFDREGRFDRDGYAGARHDDRRDARGDVRHDRRDRRAPSRASDRAPSGTVARR